MCQCVDTLTYVREGVTCNLEPGNIGLIHNFKKFVGFLTSHENGATKWMEITHDEWLQYMETEISGISAAVIQASASGTAIVATNTPKVPSPLQEFEKGICRDKAAYLILKDDKAWDRWRRSTIATARTHKCEEIFDPSYVAVTDDDKALFCQKQLFMYSVFDEKLQTDMGKNLVRTYETNSDAQKVYTLLAAHATTSTRADIESQHILTYITTARFGVGDSGWKGTGHSFILHWQNKVREYEDMVPRENYFSEGIKPTMLQNAVSGVPELHAVKSTSAIR
jgi:hypothetical protein